MSLYDRVAQRKASRDANSRRAAMGVQSAQTREYLATRDQSHRDRMTKFGIVMSEQGQKDFQSQWDAAGTNIAEAKQAIADARAKFDKEKGTVDSKWNKYEQGFVNISVVNGSNVEGTYRVPKQVADKYYSEVFNQGEGYYVANWFGDDKNPYQTLYVDVKPQGTGNAYGKELHEGLGKTAAEIKETFYDQVGTAMKAAEAEVNRTLGDYDAAIKAQETFNKDLVEGYKQKGIEAAGKRTDSSNALFGDTKGKGAYDGPKGVLSQQNTGSSTQSAAPAPQMNNDQKPTKGVLGK